MKPRTKFTFKIQWCGSVTASTFTTIQLNDGEIANALRESAWRRLWELYASTSDHIHVVELVSEEPIP